MLTNNIPSPTKIADDNLINPLYISNFSLIFLPINDRNKPIINTNIGLVPDDIDVPAVILVSVVKEPPIPNVLPAGVIFCPSDTNIFFFN